MSDQPRQPDRPGDPRSDAANRDDKLKPAEEWGERLDQGKTVARGGKTEGHVPGAEPGDRK